MDTRLLKGIVLLLATTAVIACKDGLKGDAAYISFALSSDYSDYYMRHRFDRLLKSVDDINLPDTNDFILTIQGSRGDIIYKGPYGERPDPVRVNPGSYDISLQSVEFEKPEFSLPQFGDLRTIVAGNGQTISVAFNCTQLNCGMRLIFDDSFINRFPDSDVAIKSENHQISYPYTEERVAYFLPGILRVICSDGNNEMQILSRQLDAADIMTVKLSATGEAPGTFSITIDTTRNWLYEDFTFGSGNDGSSMAKAFTVSDLAMKLGAEDVWVAGYIVGGDVTTSTVVFEPPFTKESNLAIADNTRASTREECAAIELPSSSDIREDVNLMDHPQYLGRKIYVKGDIENYFGHPGIKNIKEFLLE